LRLERRFALNAEPFNERLSMYRAVLTQNRTENVENAGRILLTPHTESVNYAKTLSMKLATL
jgi:hypothetical protein